MKLALIATACLLASCKDKPREKPSAPGPSPSEPPAAPTPAPAPPPAPAPVIDTSLNVCKVSMAILDAATCPKPEALTSLRKAKKTIDGLVETIGKVGNTKNQQFQVMCAQLLFALERDAAKLDCKVSIEAGQRAEINAMLEKWYAQRTPVVPTGDAASDAVIAQIAVMRDAACECRDAACLEGLQKRFSRIGTLPAGAPDAARALGTKLIEDAERCTARVRASSSTR